MNKILLIWNTSQLRNKILVVLGLLLLTRILAHVPIPGVDATALAQLLTGSQFLNLLNIFSGGGLANFSIAMIGVGPYITASIIMQLLTILVPSLHELQKDGGEAGRAKINQYTRFLTIPMALLQGFGTIRLLQSQGAGQLLGQFTNFQWFLTLLSITAGSLLVMWIGEIISEYGIGNGTSLIIFAGIVASLPQSMASGYQLFFKGGANASDISVLIAFAVVALLVIAGVILVTEAQRNLAVSYAKRVRGDKLVGGINTHLPLRLNQAGAIPIIFAISVMLFPALLAQFFTTAKSEFLRHAAEWVTNIFNLNSPTWAYGAIYFALVVLFTFFYTAIVFNPDEVAENIQKNGGFLPGLRPGKQTADYLYKVLNRITLPGSLFLGFIAVLPFLLQKLLPLITNSTTGLQVLSFGGTSLLIAVSVVIETMKQIEAQLTLHDYDNI